MAWQTPKTNWQAADVVSKDDFNRIEGNAQHLKDTKADKTEFNLHVNNKSNPHAVTATQVGAAPSSHSHAAGDLPSASTSAKGIVQLSTSTSSTSTTLAATASAVGTVNNNLSNKVDKPSSATSGNIAVFDGGAGKVKDGGRSISDIVITSYGEWEDTTTVLNPNATYTKDIPTGIQGKIALVTCRIQNSIWGGFVLCDSVAAHSTYYGGTSKNPSNFFVYYRGHMNYLVEGTKETREVFGSYIELTDCYINGTNIRLIFTNKSVDSNTIKAYITWNILG